MVADLSCRLRSRPLKAGSPMPTPMPIPIPIPPDPLPIMLANDLWLVQHPLGILGANFGRTTTLIRLQDSLLIHSSAPFSTATLRAILALGTPAWAVEATLAHDTFTHSLAALLPDVPWFVPQGLKTPPSAECHSLAHVPGEWRDHLDVIKIEGTPLTEEHAFFHRPSRTLIVADLIFNLSPSSNFWTRLVLRSLSGLKPEPGLSRLFRLLIKDRPAFARSVERLMDWDFDRVIVGHGNVIETNGKPILSRLWQKHAILP